MTFWLSVRRPDFSTDASGFVRPSGIPLGTGRTDGENRPNGRRKVTKALLLTTNKKDDSFMTKVTDLLCCGIKQVQYDFDLLRVDLYLPDDHCTDMTGAIQVATHWMPDCQLITTWSGGVPDTSYQLTPLGWRVEGEMSARGMGCKCKSCFTNQVGAANSIQPNEPRP